jgi:pimeloyl-ACP methyl ester carboxylesterase
MGAMSIVAMAGRRHDLIEECVAAVLLASTGVDELMGRIDLVTIPGRASNGIPDNVVRVVQFLVRGGLSDSLLLHAMPRPVARQAVKHIVLSPSATAQQVAFCTDVILSCPKAVHHQFAKLLQSLDLSGDVARLDVPTAVLVGAQDRLTPPWHARRLAEGLPVGLGMIEVPDAGHMTPVQAPDAVTTAIHALAEDHLAGPGRPRRRAETRRRAG